MSDQTKPESKREVTMTAPDLSRRLTEIKERAEKATEGPWAWEFTGDQSNEWALGVVLDENDKPLSGQIERTGDGYVDQAIVENSTAPAADAEFIAHAREDVPFLLEQLAAQSLALEEAHRQLQTQAEYMALHRKQVNGLQLVIDTTGEPRKDIGLRVEQVCQRLIAADTQRAEARQQIAQLQTRLNEKWDAADAHVTKIETQLAVLREALTTYGQCTKACASKLCANCDQYAWLHDAAEDIDEVACIQRDEQFTPNPCDCGFAALVQGSPAGDDISLFLTKSPKGEPEPGQ